MGLITKTVKVRWHRVNKEYYTNLGYVFTKMKDEFEVDIKDLQRNSNIVVYGFCDECNKDLQWKYQTYNTNVKEDGSIYCNKCSKKLYGGKNYSKARLKNTYSFEEWCKKNKKEYILNRWDYELNDCSPNDICYSTKKLYWFECDKCIKHKSELKSIQSFTQGYEGTMKCKQCTSIAQWFINNNLDINDYWDWDKNEDLDPWVVSYGSHKKIWIKCKDVSYHESYRVVCSDFTIDNNRCPCCSRHKTHPKDSVGQYIIDNYGEEFLNKIWSNKNNKTLFEYAPRSMVKVWWKCPDHKHDDFCRCVDKSFSLEFRCPRCSQERIESMIEEQVRIYIESLDYKILHEYYCSVLPKNPKTNHYMPFDNEIVLEDKKHLIVEVHGEQHYNEQFYKAINKCSKEEAIRKLHQRQLYDRYKKIYAIQNGYHYLEIPYTAFDSKETYKKLIDNKINEILNKNY